MEFSRALMALYLVLFYVLQAIAAMYMPKERHNEQTNSWGRGTEGIFPDNNAEHSKRSMLLEKGPRSNHELPTPVEYEFSKSQTHLDDNLSDQIFQFVINDILDSKKVSPSRQYQHLGDGPRDNVGTHSRRKRHVIHKRDLLLTSYQYSVNQSGTKKRKLYKVISNKKLDHKTHKLLKGGRVFGFWG